MAPHCINYSLWAFFFHSRFLGVTVNIKDLGDADRPDVLHRSHLIDLPGIQPVLFPLRFALRVANLCQAAVRPDISPGSAAINCQGLQIAY